MADKTFKPTREMAAAARRGLKLREKYGRGGTDVGVKRAEQLAAQDEVDVANLKKIHSYFARHEVDEEKAHGGWDTDDDPSAGFIAWLLWGGDAGKKWADAKVASLED